MLPTSSRLRSEYGPVAVSEPENSVNKRQAQLVGRGLHFLVGRTSIPRSLLLLPSNQRLVGRITMSRGFASVLVRQALRLRYWIIGGLVGGGYMADTYYEKWKKSLPEFSLPDWIRLDPESPLSQRLQQLKASWAERDNHMLSEWTKKVRGLHNDWKVRLQKEELLYRGIGHYAVATLLQYDAIQGAQGGVMAQTGGEAGPPEGGGKSPTVLASLLSSRFGFNKKKEEGTSGNEEDQIDASDAERIQKLQDDLLKTQLQYQRELEQLERENKTLKQRLLLKDAGEQKRSKKVRQSLIDSYSDMLDLLTEYDSSYSTTDNLPRVVVVGDQSAGKTSVLEMIAQARIFPRGSGEMMTRAPVKVTLSEGPYHVAQFRDSEREFDLTRDADLHQLRAEIERRMLNSVRRGGKTVSNEVIALTVKGPNLARMVLVDLPGVISTVTTEMATDTKDDIVRMCKQYMENPNAIVLCIQDGSVDAERSNVTDLVSAVDPRGQRTILVLTKVDLAEKNLSNPNRIRKILEGRLFPMKALGYYAVVTGMDGKHESSIDEIRRHEEDFFAESKLFRDGVLKASQMTTRNMYTGESLAVSDCFWRMVRDSIEAQADAFRANRYNLEAEWKNTFPRKRELTRDELFERARGEILDEVANLGQVSAEEWERLLKRRLWQSVADHVIEQILMPASSVDSAGSFNTLLDIKLKHWTEKELANKSVHVGWEALRDIFKRQYEHADEQANKAEGSGEGVLQPLKNAIVDTVIAEHQWDTKALDYLRVIQTNAMSDRIVPDKRQWEKSCKFMGEVAANGQREAERQLRLARGPTAWERWFGWETPTHEHLVNQAIQDELRFILHANPEHKQSLLEDDLTVVRHNLEAKQFYEVDGEQIRKQWKLLFKEYFLERLAQASRDFQAFYPNYRQGFTAPESKVGSSNGNDDMHFDLDCQMVAFFYRVNKMLSLSCSALRQQITNTEQRRLEKEVKELLDEWGQDQEKKRELLTGRQVELAEELNQVRRIQEQLEKFIVQLHEEKS